MLPLAAVTLWLGAAATVELLAIHADVTTLRDAAHRSIQAERFARHLQVLLKKSFDHVSGRGGAIEDLEQVRAEAAATLVRLEPHVDQGAREAGHSLTVESLREWEDTRQEVDRHLKRAFRLARDQGDEARRIIAEELDVLVRSRVLSPLASASQRESARLEEYGIRVARATEHWLFRHTGAPDVHRDLVPQIYEAILAERAERTAYQELNRYAHAVTRGETLAPALVRIHADQSLHALAQLLRIEQRRADGHREADDPDPAAIHAEIRSSYDRILALLALPAEGSSGEATALLGAAEALLEQQLVPGLRAIVEADQHRTEKEMARLDGFAAAILTLAVILGALALGLALATPYLAQHFLVQPVVELSDTLRRFRAGDAKARPSRRGSDELGYLADSLGELMSELGETTRRARALAYYDSVTGLPNRQLFQERLSKALVSARLNGRVAAVLTIDLDALRSINEAFGHDSGDEIMRQAADRILESLRLADVVARLDSDETAAAEPSSEVSRIGGNEFTIVLTRVAAPQEASIVAERLLHSLAAPFVLGGEELRTSASIGIAVYPLDGGEADTLLRNASAAGQEARSRGTNQYQFYSEAMNAAAARKLHIRSRLGGALERDHLVLHFQPIRSTRSGLVTGAEVLLRWTDPEIGPVPSSEFIPIAEETGLITSIGEWVINSACRQARAWQQAGFRPFRLSVNISGRQIREEDFVATVSNALEESGLDPSLLELEITETSIIRDGPAAAATLNELADMGIRFALDDFGTGYSSLSYVARFPIHRLKIDRSFVAEIGETEESAKLVGAIVALARHLDLAVVAEGVETVEQADRLREWGCDEIQGYLFSRALPPAEFERFLEREKSDQDGAREGAS